MGWLTVKNVGLSLEFKINASVQVKRGGPKILPKSQEKLEIHVHNNYEEIQSTLPLQTPRFYGCYVLGQTDNCTQGGGSTKKLLIKEHMGFTVTVYILWAQYELLTLCNDTL